MDFYGRIHPKHTVGVVRFPSRTNSVSTVTKALLAAFDLKTDHRLLYRRLGISADGIAADDGYYQLDFFTDYNALLREKKIMKALAEVRMKHGPNAIFKGMNLLEGATTLERNKQIGGHKA